MYGFSNNLILRISSTDKNALCCIATGVEEGKVNLNNLHWMLPRVTPSDNAKFERLKQIREVLTLNCASRMRKHITITTPSTNMFTL